ncbi:hypothetical protein GOP47_0026317 [Adiantum capillus-veneris]|nr:hypothetical protein GOP47_0026317 [Adiantum capillus-veneris]
MQFIFTDTPLPVPGASTFMQSILRIWSSMRAVLIRREPRCPASSVHAWLQSRLLTSDFLAEHYEIGRGIVQRMSEINAAIPQHWWDVISGTVEIDVHWGWWVYFDDVGTLMLVRDHRRFFVPAETQDCLPHIRIIFY